MRHKGVFHKHLFLLDFFGATSVQPAVANRGDPLIAIVTPQFPVTLP
jgi:hypothetical protein